MTEAAFTVSDFVAVLNQTLDFAYPSVMVTGELANFRVSKNRWVYFDLKDDDASLRCFGTVYQLPGPLEDGMMLTVRAQPRLHPLYNFSLNVQAMQVSGEGSLKRAANLLAAKLEAEGLFDVERKRPVPFPPQHIGLVTSGESAAFADFIKILNARWGGLKITLADSQVQGEAAPAQIVRAIERLNGMAQPPDVLVVTRGGGSADDLAAFSTEPVVRAVAASRIPTVVAIGHEVDSSLAELAADQRASTPSNAAELLVPDKRDVLTHLGELNKTMRYYTLEHIGDEQKIITDTVERLGETVELLLERAGNALRADRRLLNALNPLLALDRGFVLVKRGSTVVRQASALQHNDVVTLQFADATRKATIKDNG